MEDSSRADFIGWNLKQELMQAEARESDNKKLKNAERSVRQVGEEVIGG